MAAAGEASELPPALQALLADFEHDTEAIVRTLVTDTRASRLPKVIYHYTDNSGLLGILQNGTIWLSDLFYLNDPTELRYGVDHAAKLLRTAADTPNARRFASEFSTFVEQEISQVGQFFVGCFSTTADDLGQWRAYADNGKGYAIAFDTAALLNAFAPDESGKSSRVHLSVSYDEEQLETAQNKLVRCVLPLLSLENRMFRDEGVRAAYFEQLSNLFALRVLTIAMGFKHPAYRGESEFRLIQIFSQRSEVAKPKYRVRPYMLIRHIEFNWKSGSPDCLNEIVCGPASNATISRLFAADCVRAFHGGRGDVRIRVSAVPFRA
ncbi:MAG TPA: DUF2971 domain-containing protein [Rhizomicrobium sp.]